MILLYSWSKIYRAANASNKECVAIFKFLASREPPRNKFDPAYKYSQRDFSGGSFLARPDLLALNAFRYTHKEICMYLVLASLRNLSEYIIYHKTSLDCLHSVLGPELYNQNRLLSVDNDQIHFLYEEATTTEK